MRCSTLVKEVHKLRGHLADLSKFLSCARGKAFHFTTMKIKEKFEWTDKWEEAFKVGRLFGDPTRINMPKRGCAIILLFVNDGKGDEFHIGTRKWYDWKIDLVCQQSVQGCKSKVPKDRKIIIGVRDNDEKVQALPLGVPHDGKNEVSNLLNFKEAWSGKNNGIVVSWAI